MSFNRKIEKKRVPAFGGELTDKTIGIARVAKVVKGGRRFSFSALVVSGDGKGHIGFGLGKAGEVPDAISKASQGARKNMVRIPIRGTTIAHDIEGKFGPTKIVMRPAAPGTGVIAGSVVRAVMECLGIKDIKTKCVGSKNAHNVVYATINGLMDLREPESVAGMRRVALEALNYNPY